MTINYDKQTGLVPAIIQDAETKNILMLGYMNQNAYQQTQANHRVTFFSRSKQRLWTKGEKSGHYLEVVEIKNDCDSDALLIFVRPQGPTCHTGSDTCWNEENKMLFGFLSTLESLIQSRQDNPDTSSYTSALFAGGINKIAQKVGEEAVEVIIEAKDSNDLLFLNESADLLFHYLVLLRAKGFSFNDVVEILKQRH